MLHPTAGGERRAARVFVRLVGHDHDLGDALSGELSREVGYRNGASGVLTAGHRHDVVVENLVGDVCPGRNRLADRKDSRVGERAVAEILESMCLLDERSLPHPLGAFEAHRGHSGGSLVGPQRHAVATDATASNGSLRHDRRPVVRTARAEVRGSTRQFGLVDMYRDACPFRYQALRGDLDGENASKRLHEQIGFQSCGVGNEVGACGVDRADDGRGIGHAVEQVAELLFDEGSLLLDDHDHLDSCGELLDRRPVERPDESGLQNANSQARQRVVGTGPQPVQRGTQIEVRLAGGDDTEPCIARSVRRVEAVQPGEMAGRCGAREQRLVLQVNRVGRCKMVARCRRPWRSVQVKPFDVRGKAIGAHVDSAAAVCNVGMELQGNPCT